MRFLFAPIFASGVHSSVEPKKRHFEKEKIMKKLFLILLSALMLLSLASCDSGSDMESANRFIALKDDEVLTVGTNQDVFMNYEDEREENKQLTYTLSVTYTLNRTSYENGYYDSVYYNGYYYYWTSDKQTETEELGKQTTKTVYTYEYLPFGENEKVLVKTTVLTKVSCDYKGGWFEKTHEATLKLNGYFNSFDQLKNDCPLLADKIDISGKEKLYVDVTIPDRITSYEEFYEIYYYIEKK